MVDFLLVTKEPLLNLTFPHSYITASVLFPTQIRGKSLAYVVNILKSLFEWDTILFFISPHLMEMNFLPFNLNLNTYNKKMIKLDFANVTL